MHLWRVLSISFLLTLSVGCKTTSVPNSSLTSVETRIRGLNAEPSFALTLPNAASAFLTSSWTGEVTRWDLSTGNKTWERSFNRGIHHLESTIDGKFVFVAGAKGLVAVLNAQNGNVENQWDFSRYGSAIKLGVSQDGRKLAVVFLSGNMAILNAENGVELQLLPQVFEWPVIRTLKFSSDARRMLIADLGAAREIDLTSNKVLKTIRDPRFCTNNRCIPWLTAAAVSDDRRLIALGAVNEVHIYDLEDERELFKLGEHIGDVSSLKFRNASREVESIGLDGSEMAWSLAGLRLISLHTTTPPAVWNAALTQDGSKLIGIDRSNFDIVVSPVIDSSKTHLARPDMWQAKVRIDSDQDGAIRLGLGTPGNQEAPCIRESNQVCGPSQRCYRCAGAKNALVVFNPATEFGQVVFADRSARGDQVSVSLRCSPSNVAELLNCLMVDEIGL